MTTKQKLPIIDLPYSDSAKMYVDGGKQGVCSVLIVGDDVTVVRQPVPYVTNNQQEYQAIIAGLERLVDIAPTFMNDTLVTIFSDSELTIRQVKGYARVFNPTLQRLKMKVSGLRDTLRHCSLRVTFEWVSRDNNPAGVCLEHNLDDASFVRIRRQKDA